MVQTRRASQLAATDDQAGVKPPPTAEKDTRRPRKRARNDHPSAATNEPYSERDSTVGAQQHTQDASEPSPSEFGPRVSSAWKVGAHVSAAGGVENAIVNAACVRANAFALFVKSQRKWSSPPLTEANVACFKARMKVFGYEPRHVLPHGSYLVNLGNPDGEKREKSYACFLDDLERCEQLGLTLYNFHPGSTVGNATKDESISLIAQCLNRAHKETSSVITVIENMAGAKNIIGSQFTELRDIIDQVEDKSRVGVCLDTCHLYAAGYDISTKAGWDATLATFDKHIGLSYLRGMHLNDSKTPLDSKKDRHENIGLGTLKLPTFLTILSDPRVQDIPLILETPTFEAVEVWEREIQVLNTLSGIGTSSEGDMCPEGMLKEMLEDVQSVIREYRDQKENAKKAGGTPKSRVKSRGRKGKEESDA